MSAAIHDVNDVLMVVVMGGSSGGSEWCDECINQSGLCSR
jgi:hypothetical protein